jgi:nucleolar protein 58
LRTTALHCTRELTSERSAGYALFKSKDKKLLSKGDELSKDVSTVVESLKLKKFTKFENAVTALNEAAALTDGKVSPMLSNLLQELKDETKASCTLFALQL